jgi:hypothetical protein
MNTPRATTPAAGPWRDSYDAAGIDAERLCKTGTGYRVVHERTNEGVGVRWAAIPIIPRRKRART